MNHYKSDPPAVGGLYHDRHERSFLVFSVSARFVYLEYANGAVTTVCRREWESLEPRRQRVAPTRPAAIRAVA